MKLTSIPILLFIVFFPQLLAAQGIPMVCEGTECSACHLVDLANSIIQWLIGILFVVFGVLSAWSGLKLVISGGDAGARQAAKKIFLNAFIGIAIVLAAFLIVDTLMRFVLQGGNGEIQGFGPWSEVECGEQFEVQIGSITVTEPELASNAAAISANPGNCQPDPTGPCSVSALTPAFGSAATNAAIILGAESGCRTGAESSTDKTTDGRSYSIGLWQINLAAHQMTCNGKTLNCPAAFRDTGRRGSNGIRIMQITNEQLYKECVAAAKNPSCNSVAAARLYNKAGHFGDWACSAKKCGISTPRNGSCKLR